MSIKPQIHFTSCKFFLIVFPLLEQISDIQRAIGIYVEMFISAKCCFKLISK